MIALTSCTLLMFGQGVQKSVDGGLNWVLSNGEGEEYIDFRVGLH